MYLEKALSRRQAVAKIIIVIKREDENHLRAAMKYESGVAIQTIYRIKKATTAIGNLVWSHKKLFNIRETPFAIEGLAIIESLGKHGVVVSINGRPDIKGEYAESFETALGQLVKHNQELFGVKIEHHEH